MFPLGNVCEMNIDGVIYEKLQNLYYTDMKNILSFQGLMPLFSKCNYNFSLFWTNYLKEKTETFGILW